MTSTVIGPSALRTARTAFCSASMSVRSQCSKWTVLALAAEFPDQRLRRLLRDIEETDLRPLRGETGDDRFADAGPAAGDKNGAALEARIDGAVFHGICFPAGDSLFRSPAAVLGGARKMRKAGNRDGSAVRNAMRGRARLLRAVEPVAGVAEAGDDVAVVVEVLRRWPRCRSARRAGPSGGARCLPARRAGSTKRMSRAPRALEPLDGGGGGIRRRQHRVDDDDQALGHVVGRLEVIFVRLERLGIAVDADVGDARRRDEIEHAFEQAVAGAQDRGEHRLLALKDRRIHGRQRRFDVERGERQVAGDLVGQEQRDLAQQLAEARGRRGLVAHQGELVLDQRVVDDGDTLHGGLPSRAADWQGFSPWRAAAAMKVGTFGRLSHHRPH